MVNYNNGKVYKIEPICEHEENEIYIGSTTKDYLSKRMVAHRNDYKQYKNGKQTFTTSYILFDKYGMKNCKISLLEIVNCNSKDELLARETYYIRNLKCVNKVIPDRTKKEWVLENKEELQEYKKIYRLENKEEIKEYQKAYSKENKQKRSEIGKQYYQNNKEKLCKKAKDYAIQNKEKISDKGKENFICECGIECRIWHKNRHYKSKKHISFMESTIDIPS
jgi:hypothetical protein